MSVSFAPQYFGTINYIFLINQQLRNKRNSKSIIKKNTEWPFDTGKISKKQITLSVSMTVQEGEDLSMILQKMQSGSRTAAAITFWKIK